MACAVFPDEASAASLTLRHKHHIYSLDSNRYPQWRTTQEQFLLEGRPFKIPAELRVDGDRVPALPPGVVRSTVTGWDEGAIRATLAQGIGSALHLEPGSVVISRSASGGILFEGVGMPGRDVDLHQAAALVAQALEQGISDIEIPVLETPPVVQVNDPALADLGVREFVALGESNFAGSANARRHNIRTGLEKFNGHLIAQGETFSFNEVLGPVNHTTGYLKELVILGDRTIPDYGGGLCQVSTTAYRGVWEYGFPIVDRRNHSYSVRYYSPYGTDATIYPPNIDMQFLNDSPGALVMQTHVEGDNAYFLYYGTKDARRTRLAGPYTWAYTNPPANKVEYTTEIPPGTTKKLGDRVPGLRAAWFRVVEPPDGSEEIVDEFYSIYEARPLFTQIGVEAGSSLLPTAAHGGEPADSFPSVQPAAPEKAAPVSSRPARPRRR